MRTTTERPRYVTRTIVPNGSVRCAAVMAFGLNRSPLAVIRCRLHSPGRAQSYQEATVPLAIAACGVLGSVENNPTITTAVNARCWADKLLKTLQYATTTSPTNQNSKLEDDWWRWRVVVVAPVAR